MPSPKCCVVLINFGAVNITFRIGKITFGILLLHPLYRQNYFWGVLDSIFVLAEFFWRRPSLPEGMG